MAMYGNGGKILPYAKKNGDNADYSSLESYLRTRNIPSEEMTSSERAAAAEAYLDLLRKKSAARGGVEGELEANFLDLLELEGASRRAAVAQRIKDGRKNYDAGGTVTAPGSAGQPLGEESSLSNWVGPYVTDMLGKGKALAETPYQAYTGPLTAGSSSLQNKAFTGLSSLSMPTSTMGAYTPTSFTAPGVAESYMSPYLMASLAPQIAEAQRQAEIQRVQNAGRLTKAGAYGGSRQAIMESEGIRNLMSNLAGITGRGYEEAYKTGMGQFNTEEQRRQQAQEMTNKYGFDVANVLQNAGATQRGIESEGIAADYGQFKEERDDPFKKVQYMQSLLQGMPVEAQSTTYSQPSGLSSLMGTSGNILDFLKSMGILGGTTPTSNPPAGTTDLGSSTTTSNIA